MPKIERLKLTNFKSFRCVDVELGDFNVLIGPNASGKSNFVDALRFLQNIANDNLQTAISIQGGIEYLGNIRCKRQVPVSIEVHIGLDREAFQPAGIHRRRVVGLRPYRATYHLQLDRGKTPGSVNTLKEELAFECQYAYLKNSKTRKLEGAKQLAKYRIRMFAKDEKLEFRYNILEGTVLAKKVVLPIHPELRILVPRDVALLTMPFIGYPFVPVHDVFSDISIYDFDPKSPKKAVPITAESGLAEDASNLAIVLESILSDTVKKQQCIKLVQNVLPFVASLDVDRFADQLMLTKMSEVPAPDVHLPAYLLSDGTINITALIVALYFQDNRLAVFEEPDRNIHPLLISRIVNMLKDAAKRKQIIVTTHNPEMVRYAGIDNLLLITRDKEEYSTVSRPADSDRVAEFLKDDIGVEELHMAGLLGDNL